MKEFIEDKEFKNISVSLKQEIAEMTKQIYPHIKIAMTDEDLEDLKALEDWTSKILMLMDAYPEALQKEGMAIESNLAKLSEERIDFIYHQIEQKILENQ